MGLGKILTHTKSYQVWLGRSQEKWICRLGRPFRTGNKYWFGGQSGCSDRNPVNGPPSLNKSDLLGLTASNFGPYVARWRPSIVLEVAISRGVQSSLALATTWSLNQAKIHLIQRPLLGLATSTPMTEASRKTQCRLYRYLQVYVNKDVYGAQQCTSSHHRLSNRNQYKISFAYYDQKAHFYPVLTSYKAYSRPQGANQKSTQTIFLVLSFSV